MRERRLSLLERRDAASQTAAGLTSDLRAVYGLGNLSMFGTPGTAKAKPKATTAPIVTNDR
ncbi:hypothetical protein GCM10011360_17550 [Primorskyibacter flagellatus]|uniref:Uncharacterized protein n=1 Tax=Primorskyibacter flagellatus TaxID=1387277 RepID=A0A917A602_9RHOB|nr:hypothetical protein [Primorskyibacter flagellatus]GGE29969.1 hypothetical protein GCM10011360_17550 [Primorskyibacter flagellatus]